MQNSQSSSQNEELKLTDKEYTVLTQGIERITAVSRMNDYLMRVVVLVATSRIQCLLLYEQIGDSTQKKHLLSSHRLVVQPLKSYTDVASLLVWFSNLQKKDLEPFFYTPDAPLLLPAMAAASIPAGYSWVRRAHSSMNNVYEVYLPDNRGNINVGEGKEPDCMIKVVQEGFKNERNALRMLLQQKGALRSPSLFLLFIFIF
jgi:hypothetical protein